MVDNKLHFTSQVRDDEQIKLNKKCPKFTADMYELKGLTPIKIVENTKSLCALQRQVILGDGCSSAVVAIPHVDRKSTLPKRYGGYCWIADLRATLLVGMSATNHIRLYLIKNASLPSDG